jgi:arabinose-5-phosphate isomerase
MEAEAILGLSSKLSASFDRAIELLLGCTGKVVVTGVGKSGHIGSKIAATLASTGTPAFFVHPAELRHGDFGMMEERDLAVALSYSGETQEIKLAIDPIKRLGIKVIALTGDLNSTLASIADVALDTSVEREACPLNLAPTSSTTAALALGDALAIVLMQRKGFKTEDFARSHPGGNLGRQLLLVHDVMRQGLQVPAVQLDTTYAEVLCEVDTKKLGFTTVCDASGALAGIITDGDIRRAQVRYAADAFSKLAHEVMTLNPRIVAATALAVEALKTMEKHSISDLLIVDGERRPTGVIHLKDLLKAGIV